MAIQRTTSEAKRGTVNDDDYSDKCCEFIALRVTMTHDVHYVDQL